MPSTPSGDDADDLDNLYAKAERDILAAREADPQDLADRAAADRASMVDRMDEVTAAIEGETWPDDPGPWE